jgi:putative transcriptional regulator
MTTLKPEKGRLLIAEPSIIGDLSFNRSIILLAEENEKGFVGFILNKPLEYKLKDLVPEVDSNLTVYNGGPVEQDNLYFIHKVPELITDSVEIADGIFWGGNFEIIKNLLQDNLLKSQDIRFFLGYSGWGENQLEEELELNSWIVSNNHYKNKLLLKADQSLWKEKMLELGGDYVLWSNAPENPGLN